METPSTTQEVMRSYALARNKRKEIADKLLDQNITFPDAADITEYMFALAEERKAEERLKELFAIKR